MHFPMCAYVCYLEQKTEVIHAKSGCYFTASIFWHFSSLYPALGSLPSCINIWCISSTEMCNVQYEGLLNHGNYSKILQKCRLCGQIILYHCTALLTFYNIMFFCFRWVSSSTSYIIHDTSYHSIVLRPRHKPIK